MSGDRRLKRELAQLVRRMMAAIDELRRRLAGRAGDELLAPLPSQAELAATRRELVQVLRRLDQRHASATSIAADVRRLLARWQTSIEQLERYNAHRDAAAAAGLN